MENIFPTEKEKQLIEKYKEHNPTDLALKLKNNGDVRAKFVVMQISGYQAIKTKMPTWYFADIVFPVHLPLEQCSSDITAEYKTLIIKRLVSSFDVFVDITGGFGVDFYAISTLFKKSVYVERDNVLCRIVEHNFNVFGKKNCEFLNSNGIEFLKQTNEKFNLVFIDPARRNSHGKKTVFIQDCEPNIVENQEIIMQKSDLAIIKLSPMLDIANSISTLKNVKEIHVVGHKNECKEVLAVVEKNYNADVKIFTFCDSKGFDFLYNDEKNCDVNFYKSDNFVGKYLYEPDATVMKSGGFKTISKRFNVEKLHPSTHLYVSDNEIVDFPGRCFVVKKVGRVKDFVGLTANLTVRNFPIKTADLKKKLKLKDGGNVYLFATTLYNDKKVVLQVEKI